MNPVPGGTHLVDELVGSRELARATGFILNPRCRICRHDPLRTKVNGLLAFGASYAMILRSLEDAKLAVKLDELFTPGTFPSARALALALPRMLDELLKAPA